ncbi:uncharacterized protein LOC100569745 isoform X2 [Acyrthosiphon pisum]|uniref:THAP-type domain-containing protein n=1 Tax=Acyrthosiphon pisum TaxID=7029 RepID=A0A8R2NUR9_ACYPI|nr:uncharacterized protein LOC100569745 isoform X2 [Acyrthosiphon pisum]|eukprot:XP_016658425.1 PREDICTED: uncharacterized protein LOC100569745 isoform X2 [Acyrthosiphon pisum]
MIFFNIRLPKGEIREAWITFLKKYNPRFMPTTRSTSVCGLHFLTDLDYEITPSSIYQTKRLKKNAIPSIMHQNIDRSLLNKSNQELNCVPDLDTEEEVVTLSLSDLNGLRDVPPAIPIDFCTENFVCQKPAIQNANTVSLASIIQKKNKIQNATTVSPAPVIQNINKIPTMLFTVQNASTVSPSTAIQYRNEIPSVLVQSTVKDKFLRPDNKRKCFMGDFKQLSDIDSPNNRLKYWIASQSTVTKQKKKIKFLLKQTVDLKKKIKSLDNLVDQLKNEKKKELNNCITVLKQQSQHEYYMSMCKPI